MLTDKQFQDIKKNGITFELSKNGKYANIYKKGKFVSSIFGTKNTVYFCDRVKRHTGAAGAGVGPV